MFSDRDDQNKTKQKRLLFSKLCSVVFHFTPGGSINTFVRHQVLFTPFMPPSFSPLRLNTCNFKNTDKPLLLHTIMYSYLHKNTTTLSIFCDSNLFISFASHKPPVRKPTVTCMNHRICITCQVSITERHVLCYCLYYNMHHLQKSEEEFVGSKFNSDHQCLLQKYLTGCTGSGRGVFLEISK